MQRRTTPGQFCLIIDNKRDQITDGKSEGLDIPIIWENGAPVANPAAKLAYNIKSSKDVLQPKYPSHTLRLVSDSSMMLIYKHNWKIFQNSLITRAEKKWQTGNKLARFMQFIKQARMQRFQFGLEPLEIGQKMYWYKPGPQTG